MALHPDFPESPHAIIDPSVRWLPDQTLLLGMDYGMLLPPLVHKIREQVKTWRDDNYSGASETSKALLNWWFNTPHLREQDNETRTEFRYYFAQREALETIIYLSDVIKVNDQVDLLRFDSSRAISTGFFDENWRRFVIKMATGTGKTKVMSLAIAWSFFHKLYEQDSELSRNFLVIAPNIIVLDRLYHDFQGLRIFFNDPVLPDNGFEGNNWRDDFQLTLHVQDEVRTIQPTGNIFLTNIHRVYSSDQSPPSPDDENSMDYFFGKQPTGATTDSKVDLGDIVRDIDELMVLNDEAHHVHDPKLAWFKSIEDIHNRLLQKGSGLALQVDVSATPKHSNGAIFVQTVADYPLVEAISQNIVKHPLDYINADGDIANYYPDFVVKLTNGRVVVVETKGREDLDVPLKMQRLSQGCEDVNRVSPEVNYDFVYVDQENFDVYRPETFQQLLEGFTEYKSPL